jgi:flagellar hook-associated protein 1 FlgK
VIQAGNVSPALTNPGDPTIINQVLNIGFGTALSFATSGMGPGANLSSGLPGNTTILDFTQQVIAKQANDKALVDQRETFETAFRDALVKRGQDQSGVNLDSETAAVLTVQKSYSAAAHVVTAVNKMMDDLLAAIR